MASTVEICNGALNQLGATTILSLTEDSKNARLCNSRFTQVRDSVFRSHPWNCLQKRVEIAVDTTAPAWGFSFAYTLPADCLRLLRILDYDSNYKVEGRKILSNSSTMKILYISKSIIPSRTANSIHVMKMCQAFKFNNYCVDLLFYSPAEDISEDDIFINSNVEKYLLEKYPFLFLQD